MKTPRFATIDLNEVALDNLEPVEIGVYALLLKACFANNGKLRIDSKLKFFAKTSSHIWNRVWPKISHLFYEDGEKNLRSEIVDFRLERLEQISDVRAAAAHKRHAKARANAMQMDMQLHPEKPPHTDAFAHARTEKGYFPTESSENKPPRPRARPRRHIPNKMDSGVRADIEAKGTPPPATPERSYTPVVSTPRQAKMMSSAKANLDCKVARFIEHIGGPKAVGQYWEVRNGPDPTAAQEVLDSSAAAMRASGWEDVG